MSLVDTDDIEDLFVKLLRTQLVLDEQGDHVHGLQRLSHLVQPPC